MTTSMNKFAGDLSRMWKLQERPPLHHLTWDWWWWLLMLDDEEEILAVNNLWCSGQQKTTPK